MLLHVVQFMSEICEVMTEIYDTENSQPAPSMVQVGCFTLGGFTLKRVGQFYYTMTD